jgi:hypothetical protein
MTKVKGTKDQELYDLLEIVDEVFEESERKRFLQTIEGLDLHESKKYLIRLYDSWKIREKEYISTIKAIRDLYEASDD